MKVIFKSFIFCVYVLVNGGEMTPNSQRSVPSPEASDDLLCSGSSSGGNKSGLSSPAQFVPVSCAIAASCSDSCNAPTPPSSALMVHESVDHLRDTSQLKHIETFVSSLQQVLSDKLNPDATLADASQLIQLSDVHMCLDSLLRVHKKVSFLSIHFFLSPPSAVLHSLKSLPPTV